MFLITKTKHYKTENKCNIEGPSRANHLHFLPSWEEGLGQRQKPRRVTNFAHSQAPFSASQGTTSPLQSFLCPRTRPSAYVTSLVPRLQLPPSRRLRLPSPLSLSAPISLFRLTSPASPPLSGAAEHRGPPSNATFRRADHAAPLCC